MVVPTIGLAVTGLYADLHWHTGPWLTIGGTIIGMWLAVQLVKRQIRDVS
jgi:F0F1-type ATP synthase assembly protein I